MKRLPLTFLILMLYFAPLPVITAEVQPTPLEVKIHRLINEERVRNSLPELLLQSTLIEVARLHSQDMQDNDFFDHINEAGEGPADRVKKVGIKYSEVRENLYWTSDSTPNQIAETAVDGWINSPGHYQSILSSTSYTGIGISNLGNAYYVTQVFIEATLTDMQSNGVVYDNKKLDAFGTVDGSKFPSFLNISPTSLFTIALIIVIIVIGRDAKKRNRRVYRR